LLINFFTVTRLSEAAERPPIKCIPKVRSQVKRDVFTQTSDLPPLNSTEKSDDKFCLNLRHYSIAFEMQQDIWNLKQTWRASMIVQCPLPICLSSVHAPLRTVRRF